MSGTSLTRELALLSDAFGYDLDDLETFQLNAAASAFLPLDDREELAELHPRRLRRGLTRDADARSARPPPPNGPR